MADKTKPAPRKRRTLTLGERMERLANRGQRSYEKAEGRKQREPKGK